MTCWRNELGGTYSAAEGSGPALRGFKADLDALVVLTIFEAEGRKTFWIALYGTLAESSPGV